MSLLDSPFHSITRTSAPAAVPALPGDNGRLSRPWATRRSSLQKRQAALTSFPPWLATALG